MTGRPGGLEDQLGLLLGAVQQTDLEESKEGKEGTGTRKDTHTNTHTHTHTHIHTSEIRRGPGRGGEGQMVAEGRG